MTTLNISTHANARKQKDLVCSVLRVANLPWHADLYLNSLSEVSIRWVDKRFSLSLGWSEGIYWECSSERSEFQIHPIIHRPNTCLPTCATLCVWEYRTNKSSHISGYLLDKWNACFGIRRHWIQSEQRLLIQSLQHVLYKKMKLFFEHKV